MLSCSVCRKRKKKCDFNLPSCKNCEALGTVCLFYDEGLGKTVSRRYLKSLDDRVKELKHEIKIYESKILQRKVQDSETSHDSRLNDTVKTPLKSGCFVEGKSDTYYFGPGSIVSLIYSAAKLLNLDYDPNRFQYTIGDISLPQLKVPFDLMNISSDHIRLLIENYLSSIYPSFPLLSENFFHFEVTIRNYPAYEQLFVLLIFLISATNLMRKQSDFVYIKIMLHQKVIELMKVKVAEADGDTLLALVYYSIYESMDPESNPPLWKTLSLACGLAEKLRLSDFCCKIPLTGKVCDQISRISLFKTLYQLEINVSMCLGRPPAIYLSRNQILNLEIDDTESRLRLLELTSRIDLFRKVYGKDARCPLNVVKPIVQDYQHEDLHCISFWSLLQHGCTDCVIYLLDSNAMKASINLINETNKKMKSSMPVCFWVETFNITVSLLSIAVVLKFRPEALEDKVLECHIMDALHLGRKLLVEYATLWNSAQPWLSFTELVFENFKKTGEKTSSFYL
ncbi:hypothetical protein OGAPHI_005393 [Ogataea philodendri]|uniref:Zn(2)-C6 fungal-type domain-containing protein n=1 Tax=Ogataea philodendri TaxID=1378263 RepID=A0A9P8P0P0_9ASCO|nr:uncharacterized protein OGAPHI_005393 [Ogataea philodendri]KAH3663403.1 hypothetical protein OGAPHI_005393 [Ogataea philodendri]